MTIVPVPPGSQSVSHLLGETKIVEIIKAPAIAKTGRSKIVFLKLICLLTSIFIPQRIRRMKVRKIKKIFLLNS